jgi:hypothetical protein
METPERVQAIFALNIALAKEFSFATVRKFVIPNPALSGEGSAFLVASRTADPSRKAVRDDRLREWIQAGIAWHKLLAPVRAFPSKLTSGAGVYVFTGGRKPITAPPPHAISAPSPYKPS